MREKVGSEQIRPERRRPKGGVGVVGGLLGFLGGVGGWGWVVWGVFFGLV